MQRDGAHLGRGDLDAGPIPALVQLRAHPQPGRGAGVADQIDDRFERPEGASSPVGGDVTEEPMLDLVPLARARWEVTHGDAQCEGVSQALQFGLPRPRAIAIAAASIGSDQQVRGHRIGGASHHAPPLANGRDREGRRVVVRDRQ